MYEHYFSYVKRFMFFCCCFFEFNILIFAFEKMWYDTDINIMNITMLLKNLYEDTRDRVNYTN